MSFGAGFVEGFANTLAKGMTDRQAEARDYFNKQVDYAKTTGLANRRKTQAAVESNLSIANQLQQVGVPKNLIMAVVNQDPQGLGNFYTQAQAIQERAGKSLTADEWTAISEVGGNFQAPDEDLATFISRTYDPIANAINSPGFEDNPKESLLVSLMGFNQMDKARKSLGTRIIADGMTADQLIAYGDSSPQRIGGDAVVTTNFENIPQKPKSDEERLLRSSDFTLIIDQVREELAFHTLGEGDDGSAVRDALVVRMGNLYPTADPQQLQAIIEDEMRLRRVSFAPSVDTGATPSPAEGPSEVLPTEGSPEETKAPVAPPTASNEPVEVVRKLDELINNPNLSSNEQRSLTTQRETLVFAMNSGRATANLVATTLAYINQLGGRVIEGVGYPVSIISPAAGEAVFNYADQVDAGSRRLADTFRPRSALDTASAPITPEETYLQVFTLPNDDGVPTEYTFVRDNKDGYSVYRSKGGEEEEFSNSQLRALLAK
jgi:hypothetical protein